MKRGKVVKLSDLEIPNGHMMREDTNIWVLWKWTRLKKRT